MKTRVLRGINVVIAAILSFLGFGCSKSINHMYGENPAEVMYGVPMPVAEYEISGKITDETSNNPIKNIRVTVKTAVGNFEGVSTKNNGSYDMLGAGRSCERVNIVAEDPSGVYAPDSAQVELVFEQEKGLDPMYSGKATVHQDFQLKKK